MVLTFDRRQAFVHGLQNTSDDNCAAVRFPVGVNGKTILVVGGRTGIGQSLCHQLTERGAEVFTMSREKNDQAGVTSIVGPVQDARELLAGLPAAIDGVVYCPGTINLRPFPRLSVADFQNDYEVNLLGAVHVLQATLPRLQKAPTASVVLFSTVAVQTGMAFHASVAAAKGAVEGLTRSLAAEYAPSIRVNAVAPSLTDTPLAARLLNGEQRRESSAQRHPLKRLGTPRDAASAALFLLSSDSAWMTGQILAVDGGMGSVRMMS